MGFNLGNISIGMRSGWRKFRDSGFSELPRLNYLSSLYFLG
jgi:hypothetical protein